MPKLRFPFFSSIWSRWLLRSKIVLRVCASKGPSMWVCPVRFSIASESGVVFCFRGIPQKNADFISVFLPKPLKWRGGGTFEESVAMLWSGQRTWTLGLPP